MMLEVWRFTLLPWCWLNCYCRGRSGKSLIPQLPLWSSTSIYRYKPLKYKLVQFVFSKTMLTPADSLSSDGCANAGSFLDFSNIQQAAVCKTWTWQSDHVLLRTFRTNSHVVISPRHIWSRIPCPILFSRYLCNLLALVILSILLINGPTADRSAASQKVHMRNLVKLASEQRKQGPHGHALPLTDLTSSIRGRT